MAQIYCIHGLDNPEGGTLREMLYDAHRAFLETSAEYGVTIRASGPLVSDDGERMIGSLFIVEADSKKAVRTFNAADPFAKADLWTSIAIHRFHLRIGSVGAVNFDK